MRRFLFPTHIVPGAFCSLVTTLVFVLGSAGPALAGGAVVKNQLAPTFSLGASGASKEGKRGSDSKTTSSDSKPSISASKLRLPAKKLFGYERRAADMEPRAIGTYSRGCLAGGKMLAPTGKYWQAMRLSRNRNWAHPNMVALVEKLARDAHDLDGWNGLLVGDLTQPRGGPMLSGHKSHQIGLDADVWLREMPQEVMSRKKRETFQPISMLKNALSVDYKHFTDKHVALIRRAASYPEVARVGVNPAIKHALCKAAGGDKPWLAKIQGWPGHHYHMHIRLKCPPGSKGCRGQGPPRGTSCAASEKWYRNAKAWADLPAAEKKRRTAKANKNRKKRKPKPPITLAGLPSTCVTVLTARNRDEIEDPVILPVANPSRGQVPKVPQPTLARRQ